MKVSYNQDNGFRPVTFSITCETPEELFALWYRFNLNYHVVVKNSGVNNNRVPTGILTYCEYPNTYPAFKVINEVVDEYLKNLEGN